MSLNQTIYSLRVGRSLTRKEAAKGIGISRFWLLEIEKGYLTPNEKALKKIAAFYEVDLKTLQDDSSYPLPIELDKKPSKISLTMKKKAKPLFWVCVGVFAVFV